MTPKLAKETRRSSSLGLCAKQGIPQTARIRNSARMNVFISLRRLDNLLRGQNANAGESKIGVQLQRILWRRPLCGRPKIPGKHQPYLRLRKIDMTGANCC